MYLFTCWLSLLRWSPNPITLLYHGCHEHLHIWQSVSVSGRERVSGRCRAWCPSCGLGCPGCCYNVSFISITQRQAAWRGVGCSHSVTLGSPSPLLPDLGLDTCQLSCPALTHAWNLWNTRPDLVCLVSQELLTQQSAATGEGCVSATTSSSGAKRHFSETPRAWRLSGLHRKYQVEWHWLADCLPGCLLGVAFLCNPNDGEWARAMSWSVHTLP